MDFLSHLVWAFVLFHSQPWGWLAVFFCVLPDLLWWFPRLLLKANLKRKKIEYDEDSDLQTRWLYRANHSLVTWAIVVAASYLVFGAQVAAGLAAGWLLHIFMDVWTHKGGIVNGIRLFYPLFDWRFPAVVYWRETVRDKPWVYLLNLALAAAVYLATA